ncbi:MAG: TetR/AcrR family transcriptional regulator [Ilumatobacteraceae bacterium]
MDKSNDSIRAELTRARLLDAAMGLFARRGVAATTVGDIESAAGLAPRSGALYKYFGAKDELLTAGLERHLSTVRDLATELTLQPLGEPRAELTLLARWLLDELENERDITHVLERDGEQVTALRDRMRSEISDQGYRIGAHVIGRWRADIPEPQRERLAVVLVGALINYKRSTWTLGAAPLGVPAEQICDTWVDTCLAVLWT